jgi:hypothetical protein
MSVYVILQGGLANQMFQLAMGRIVGKLLDRKVVLLDDWLRRTRPNVTPRAFALHSLNQKPTPSEGRLLAAKVWASEIPVLNRLLRRCDPSLVTDHRTYSSQDILKWNAHPALLLSGYWQNQGTLFEEFRKLLLDGFRSREASSIPAHPCMRGVIAIHVRRGDYVSNPTARRHHGLLPVDYYERAIAQLKLRCDISRLEIFSDDPLWCERDLKFEFPKSVMPMSMDPIQDLWRMSHYEGLIIANSSFSWWAAWLSQAEVVAPAQWTTAGTSVYIPRHWVRV